LRASLRYSAILICVLIFIEGKAGAMNGIQFNGEPYNDDRMFVLYICKCTVNTIEGDTVETTIYHENAPEAHKWCLVTYKNIAKYPAVRVDHFESLKAAEDYMKKNRTYYASNKPRWPVSPFTAPL
jgi:hypothetical protein